MTWAEFKKAMESAGVVDTDVVDYIDVGWWTTLEVAFKNIGAERHIRVTEN